MHHSIANVWMVLCVRIGECFTCASVCKFCCTDSSRKDCSLVLSLFTRTNGSCAASLWESVTLSMSCDTAAILLLLPYSLVSPRKGFQRVADPLAGARGQRPRSLPSPFAPHARPLAQMNKAAPCGAALCSAWRVRSRRRRAFRGRRG